MFVRCVLSGRGLCDELITRPEAVLPTLARRCVLLRNLENEKAIALAGLQNQKKKIKISVYELVGRFS
jgi:hypothetical protein